MLLAFLMKERRVLNLQHKQKGKGQVAMLKERIDMATSESMYISLKEEKGVPIEDLLKKSYEVDYYFEEDLEKATT